MSELYISPREEQTHATIAAMQERIENQSPDEKAASLNAGLDLMLEDYEKDPTFFTRMGELAVKRANAERTPDAWYDTARQIHGALGYDTKRPYSSRNKI